MGAALSRKNHLVPTTPISLLGTAGGIGTDPAYPLANMLDPDPTRVGRWTYTLAGTSYPEADFGAAMPPTRVVGAMNVRLDLAHVTSVALQLVSTGGSQLQLITFNAADLVPIPDTTDRFNLCGITAVEQTTLQRLRLRVTTIAASGYAECGHLWAGPGLVFPEGVDALWSIGYVDPTDVQRPPGGGFVSSPMPTRLKLNCPVAQRTYNEAMGTPGSAAFENMRNIIGSVGRSRPVVMVARSADTHAMQTMSVYGLMSEIRDIGHQGGNNYATQFSVEQIR